MASKRSPQASELARRGTKKKSANAVISNAVRVHTFNVLRSSISLQRKIVKMLVAVESDLATQLMRQTPSTLNKARRMSEFLANVRGEIKSAYSTVAKTVATELTELAEVESLFAIKNINASVGFAMTDTYLTRTQVENIVGDMLIKGAPSSEWWGRQAASVADAFADQVRMGMMQGDTLGQIAQRIKGGTRDGFPVPGVPGVRGVTSPGMGFMTRPRKNAEALVRTSYLQAANDSRMAAYQANGDVVKGIQQISTLDSRTTEICVAYSGACWDLDFNPINGTTLPYLSGVPRHWGAVAEGELVRTSDGLVPIENIAIGNRVLTHLGRYRRVYATMAKFNESGVVRVVKLESGTSIRLTNDHPVLVSRSGVLSWLRVDQFKIGDQLLERVQESSPRRSFLSTELSSNSCPAELPKEDITFDVFSGEVRTSRVDFNNDLLQGKSKVANISVDDKLSLEIDSAIIDDIEKLFFALGKKVELLASDCFSVGLNGFFEATRVVLDHATRLISITRMRLFGKTPSPVILTAEFARLVKLANDLFCRFFLASDLDTMNLTPVLQNGFSHAKLSLDLPDGFSVSEMFSFDDVFNKSFVSEHDTDLAVSHEWLLSRVTDIDSVEYSGKIYNIAVEDDESYTVGDVIVHNCRSVEAPLLKTLDEILGTTGIPDIPDGTRSSIDGYIPADTTFDNWLSDKSEDFQDELLGSGKAQLWRDGKITLQDLVDPQTGQPLTLAELRETIGED